MSATYTWKGTIAATAIVTIYPDTSGNFWGDGTADDVELQAAIDYVGLLGGGEVYAKGTYQITVAVDVDYDVVFLRGSGWNTVLNVQAGVTPGIHIFGTAGTHIEGVFLRDFKLYMPYDDTWETGVLIEYAEKTWCHNLEVTHSKGYGIYVHNDSEFCVFENLYVHDNTRSGLLINDGTSHRVVGCHLIYNGTNGLFIGGSSTHIGVVGNNLSFNGGGGLYIATGDAQVTGNDISNNHAYGIRHISGAGCITGNVISRNGSIDGITKPGGQAIVLDNCMHMAITGNQINHTYYGTNFLGEGIYLTNGCEDIEISGNQIWSLPVDVGAGVDGIFIEDSIDISIVGNEISTVTGYGVNVSNAGCIRVQVKENKLVNCVVGCINDAGTGTMLDAIKGEFNQYGGGSAGRVAPVINTSPGGIDVDANDEFVDARIPLGSDVQQVVRIVIWAYAQVDEADRMRLRIVAHGATDNEAWSGNPIDVANHPSESLNFSNLDVIYWIIDATDDAQIGTLAANDYIELLACGEVAGNGDCATDALFGGYEIQIV